jgi:hypothetical protein
MMEMPISRSTLSPGRSWDASAATIVVVLVLWWCCNAVMSESRVEIVEVLMVSIGGGFRLVL